jgi:ferric-dicitrate binding protein FerR (iron transport regulator)
MNLSDDEVLELNELCNALIDGALADAQRTQLESWLARSEAARQYYVRAMGLSASLCDYANEMQAEAPDAPSKVIRPAAWQWTLGALAAAAAVMLAFWFGMKESGVAPNSAVAEQESEETVARLSGAKDVQWLGETPRPGDELRRGQRIEIAAGFAEITFDSGARVTVEGPAALELTSAWEAVLHHGTLRANVPTEAIGFRVSNPEVEVVDLGTEFTMVADAKGGTEVYVLQGAVEAAARDGVAKEPVVLREKQARRFGKNGVSEVANHDQKIDRFIRNVVLDRLTRPASYVHWRFDETNGLVARGEALGAAHGSFNAQLSAEGKREAGRWQNALVFDGTFSAQAAYPGIAQRRARTVAFWVRADDGSQLPESGPMMAWPLGVKDTRAVEVAWNRNPNQGPLGALRTRVGRGFYVGSTPARDGRWHHVAVVFLPRQKGDAAPQIKHYIDGRLDTVAWKHGGKRAPGETVDLIVPGEETLWLGQGLGADSERFRGELDEVFVADRALTPYEIRYLMTHNTPAPTEMLAAE